MHRTIRMVERADRNGYRETSTSETRHLLDTGTVRFEGVDGDEDANTVVYWYTRDVEDV